MRGVRYPLALLLLGGATSLAETWPAWRGPRGDGISVEREAPLRWSASENVRWKTPLPGPGSSSPVVWKDRIFLTQAVERGQRRLVMCLDRADGKVLWQKETVFRDQEKTHRNNPYCSATPVTDGERVIASLGSAGLVCYDFDGKLLWKKDVGKMDHIWGNASSPILHEELAILWAGPGPAQSLLAVNKTTGETVWKHAEPGGRAGGSAREWTGSWSTPLVVRVDSREELTLSVPGKVKAFDPRTGKELWSCAGLGKLVYASPVCSDDGVVVAMSGYHGPALAVRAGGSGDVTATHRLWHHDARNPQRIGSPIILGEHVYMINEQGVAQCFELRTGKDLLGKERVISSTWSSPVYAAGRIYLTGRNAETVVLAARPELKQLARNKLDEPMQASIAISDGELFIRTFQHLWCIAELK